MPFPHYNHGPYPIKAKCKGTTGSIPDQGGSSKLQNRHLLRETNPADGIPVPHRSSKIGDKRRLAVPKIRVTEDEQSLVKMTAPLKYISKGVTLGHIINGLNKVIMAEFRLLRPRDLYQAMNWIIKLEKKESPRLKTLQPRRVYWKMQKRIPLLIVASSYLPSASLVLTVY